LAVSYGKFDVKQALPKATTISRKLPSIVAERKNDVRQRLAAAGYVGLALTTDGWPDDHRKYLYVTTTARFFSF